MTTEVYDLTGVKSFPFPYPVRYPGQLTLEMRPGGVVPPTEYEVIGYGPAATGVTIRWPNAPGGSSGSQLVITRFTEPERVSQFPDDEGVTARALNAEFDNAYQAIKDFSGAMDARVDTVLDAELPPRLAAQVPPLVDAGLDEKLPPLVAEQAQPFVDEAEDWARQAQHIAIGDAIGDGPLQVPTNESLGAPPRTVASIAELRELRATNRPVQVLGYHGGDALGGGIFQWDAARPKGEHNGGTVVDPDAPFPEDWAVAADVNAWFASENPGFGCFVRLDANGSEIRPEWFGVRKGLDEDQTLAFQAAYTFADSSDRSLDLGDGEVRVDGPITGGLIEMYGGGMWSTTIRSRGTGWIFDVHNTAGRMDVGFRHFALMGTAQYEGPKGVRATPAYQAVMSNILLRNLSAGIHLYSGWGSKIETIKAYYCAAPIFADKFNGGLLSHVYLIRFKGIGIDLPDPLVPKIESIILEYGMEGATGMRLLGSTGASIDGFYLEGDMGVGLQLWIKNQRFCKNTNIRGLRSSAQSSTYLVDAYYSKGTSIHGLELQGSAALDYIIRTPHESTGEKVRVSNVMQYDQNANDLMGDRREVGQPLTPIADKNAQIVMTAPTRQYGDGSVSDLTNIQNNTVPDANGIYPLLSSGAGLPAMFTGAELSETSPSASNTMSDGSPGAVLMVENYGSVRVLLVGTIENSAQNAPYTEVQLRNDTHDRTSPPFTISGTVLNHEFFVPVGPGVNLIRLQCARIQGGGGVNTVTVNNVYVIPL